MAVSNAPNMALLILDIAIAVGGPPSSETQANSGAPRDTQNWHNLKNYQLYLSLCPLFAAVAELYHMLQSIGSTL